jgi:DNA-binding cell septation regulator SpoVG
MVEVIRLYRMDNVSSVKAFADVVIGGVLIKGIRIVKGGNGLFAGMPKARGKDGRWYDTVRIIDKDLGKELNEHVLEVYNT